MAKKVEITITPASGKATKLSVKSTGNSVAEVLAEAGRESKGMNILVNGKPAKLDTHVTGGDEIKLTERAKGS